VKTSTRCLALTARATATAFAGLIPILPEKALAGLRQLNIDPAGKTLQALLSAANSLSGTKVSQGEALFPKVQPPKPA
jgi:methionyl-tRNA synthetase